MPKTHLFLATAFVVAATSGGALAQNAPLALPGAAQRAIEKNTPPAKVPTQDGAAAIQRANAWLNANKTMVGDFSQSGADGKQTTGKFYVDRPGKMRFTYASPATLDVIADGTTVRILDRKLPNAPNDYRAGARNSRAGRLPDMGRDGARRHGAAVRTLQAPPRAVNSPRPRSHPAASRNAG